MPVTLDTSVEHEARRLMCGILYYYDTHAEWPLGRNVTQMSGYKAATDKAAVMKYMLDHHWITNYESSNSHPKGIGYPRKHFGR